MVYYKMTCVGGAMEASLERRNILGVLSVLGESALTRTYVTSYTSIHTTCSHPLLTVESAAFHPK